MLEHSLQQQPALLVLDNVSQQTAAAALPFLTSRSPASLLLATSWDPYAFQALGVQQTRAGQLQPAKFTLMDMGRLLPLQTGDAEQLIRQQIAASRQTSPEQLAELAPAQLAALAEKAAAALAFGMKPRYVPKVLSVCACTLGLVNPDADCLERLLQQLRTGQQPDVDGSQTLVQHDLVFHQLTACLEQLRPLAQQVWVDLVRAAALMQPAALEFDGIPSLVLWLQCHSSFAPLAAEVLQQVRS